MAEIYRVTFIVYDDFHFDCNQTVNHAASFKEITKALEITRDELSRNINEGPEKCPFKHKT